MISSSGKVGAGGALYTASPSWVHVANTQITGNMATDGGIASFDVANITLTNVT